MIPLKSNRNGVKQKESRDKTSKTTDRRGMKTRRVVYPQHTNVLSVKILRMWPLEWGDAALAVFSVNNTLIVNARNSKILACRPGAVGSRGLPEAEQTGSIGKPHARRSARLRRHINKKVGLQPHRP